MTNCPKPVCKSFKPTIWPYDRGGYDTYRRILSDINWDVISASGNVDFITRDVSAYILDAVARCILNRYVNIRKSNLKWITNEIRKFTRKKTVHSLES